MPEWPVRRAVGVVGKERGGIVGGDGRRLDAVLGGRSRHGVESLACAK